MTDKIINCGAYATGPSGVTHSNAGFYQASTAVLTNEGTENPSATRQPSAALALKVRLAELADQQPHDGKNVHAFNGKSAMAEWPVFMAFARLVGPITVYSVPAGARIATSYTWAGTASGPAALAARVYMYHNNLHFQRMVQVPAPPLPSLPPPALSLTSG